MKRTISIIKGLAIVIVIMICTPIVLSQERFTAVLDHEGVTKVFYGSEALQEAMQEAKTGDKISLSAGSFKSTTINKAVKLQGIGVATKIIDATGLKLQDGNEGLYIEGIEFQGSVNVNDYFESAVFKRCAFMNNVNIGTSSNNIQFIQCRFDTRLMLNPGYYSRNAKAILLSNCLIGILADTKSGDEVTVKNCLVLGTDKNLISATFLNSILLNGVGTSDKMSFSHVLMPNDSPQISGDSFQDTVIYLSRDELLDIFIDDNTYQLTQEAAAKYLGTDDTQIGLYGGAFPYTMIPAIPQIISAKIGPKVDNEGNLSISISAEAHD